MFRMRQYTTRASSHQHLFLGNRCPHCETGGREAGRIYTDATWLSDKLRLEMSTQYIFGKWDPKGLLPNYDKQLRTQGRAFAKQLLEGCWRAFEGQYFNNWEPNRPVRNLEISDVSVHVYSEAAWAEFNWDFSAMRRKEGSSVSFHGTETQIYRKNHDGWCLVHVHYSALPTEKKARTE